MIYCHKKWFLAVFGAKKWFTGAKNHFLPVQKWFFTQENDFEGTQKWFSWNDFWNILCRFWRCDLRLGKKTFPSEMGISGNERKSFFSRKCSTTSPHSFKRFSILEEKCCADIINGWRQNNLQQIFSVRQILKKSTRIFFVHAQTKNMTSFEVFSRVAWRHSWHRSSLELELLSYCFALREAL